VDGLQLSYSWARSVLAAEAVQESLKPIELVIPWRTLLKVIVAVALVWMWLKLVELGLVMIVAVLLAVTLNPIVSWLERRRLPRAVAATLVGFVLVAVVGGFLAASWASLSSEATLAAEHIRQFERDTLQRLPGWVREAVGGKGTVDIQSQIAPYALGLGQSALSAIVVALLAFVLTLYLLIEGRRTRDWLMAFVPRAYRGKVMETLRVGERVIFAYVASNVITSIFAALVVGVALSLLHVPGALLLALIAGLFDFVPVVGFILSSIFAVIMALSVSPGTAIAVLALYGAYHFVENYVIAPWAYGDRLKLSNLAVILAFAIGATVAGVIGALIALPVAAVYPAIEQIWLRDALADDTVAEHRAIEHRKAG
jgi:predicted PurR-regulated permease PerM